MRTQHFALPLISLVLTGIAPQAVSQERASARPLMNELHRTIPLDGIDSTDVVLTDLDGDGDLDAIVTAQPGLLVDGANHVRINDGSGVFSDRTDILPAHTDVSFGVAVGDLDGDGDEDLLIANDGQNRLYLRDPGLSFSDATGQLPVDTSTSWDVLLGDVDGDGDLDAFFANLNVFAGGALNSLYLNDGNANFTDASGLLPGASRASRCAAFGDLDGDGDLDLVIGNDWPNAEVLINTDGAGSYQASDVFFGGGYTLPSADDIGGVAVGDVDGDGDLDIAWGLVGILLGESNKLWINDGTGRFVDESGRIPQNQEITWSLLMADLDGDLDLDIYAVNRRFCDPFGGCLAGYDGHDRTYINNGSGIFAEGPPLPFEEEMDVDAALGDVDGDGDVDVMIVVDGRASPNDDRLYLGDGTGAFTDATLSPRLPIVTVVDGVTLDDVDGDGDDDVLISVNFGKNQMWLNRHPLPFLDASANLPNFNGFSQSMILGDIDADGDKDMLVANRSGINRLHRNDGGVFTDISGQLPANTSNASGGVFADVDSDGDLDILIPNNNRGQDLLHLNDGAGNFTDVTITHLPALMNSSWSMSVVDVDADGDEDLLVCGESAVYLHLNDGSGVFTQDVAAIGAGIGGGRDLEAADLDGDGDVDFMTASPFGFVSSLALNDGSGSFIDASAQLPAANFNGNEVDFIDADADGDLDALIYGYRVGTLLLNDGTANFVDRSDLIPPVPDDVFRYDTGDLDGDGDLDAVLTSTEFRPRAVHNLSRQIAWHNVPSTGKSWQIDAWGAPSDGVVMAYALDTASIPLAVGTLRLDPLTLSIFGAVTLDELGAGSLSGAIPADPGLVGTAVFWQGYFVGDARLSNVDMGVIGAF